MQARGEFEASGADERWMREALGAAREAAGRGEVPVGACVVGPGGALLALREAARRVGNYRLTGAVVYSTVEPCAMCAGALVQARVERLVYGARDEKAGAVESVFRVCDASSLNHRMTLTRGVLEPECRALMQEFFRARRVKTLNSER